MMKHGAKWLAILVGMALLWGCADEPMSPEVGESFTLAPGERAELSRVHADVSFLRVSVDSRCPRQLQCVWAGDGAVVVRITLRDGDATEHILHTNEQPKATVLGRYELVLLTLAPYPEVPGGIAPEDYRATLALYERLE